MKLSLNWIKDYVALDTLTPAEVIGRVTICTAEVEGAEAVYRHFKHVVTARVLKVMPHPNADKLHLVRVSDGLNEMEVVCGAPNVAEGQIVVLARAGAPLPKGVLAVSTIRGVRSEGMLCAEDELGLSEDHAGLLVLPPETPIGMTLDQLFGGEDLVFEVENKSLTHRPDLWGHVGFAREFAAIYGKTLDLSPLHAAIEAPVGMPDPLRVENLAPELCPRYSALVVRNLTVRPSPMWMQQRLRAVGIRPINNLVDVTNYVMLDMAQPMHAFDRRQIAGDLIRVRRAEAGERFTTLDDQTHTLTTDAVVIADAERAVALGGVMGGKNSEIVPDTTCVVFESANFHPATIRRTATRLNLRTESAQRFEKAQDPANTVPALGRALALLRLTCPEAEVASPLIDLWPVKPAPVSIDIEFEHIHARLGERLPEERIVDILRRLQFDVQLIGTSTMRIGVPSYRATKDVSLKADIVEEIGRIFGYDNIQPTAPKVLSDPPEATPSRAFEWRIKDCLVQRLGFSELYNYSFTNVAALEACGFSAAHALVMKNPLSPDADRMRPTLIPHLVGNVEKNQRFFSAMRLFEIGHAIVKLDPTSRELPVENMRLTGAVAGEEGVFFAAKGAVQELLAQLGFTNVRLPRAAVPPCWAHPGRVIDVFVNDEPVGAVGELHPRVTDRTGVKLPMALFDLDFDKLLAMPRPHVRFASPRRFPVNPIEMTVVMEARREVAEVESVIRANPEHLLDVQFMYVYEGERVAPGKKAVTYHVVFGADDRTLSGDEVGALHKQLSGRLREAGLPLRGEE